MEKQSGNLRILWFFLRQYKPQVLGLFVFSILVGGVEAATVATVYPILNSAFLEGAAEGNIVLSIFKSIAGLLPVVDELIAYCLLFIILAFLAFVIKVASVRYRTQFVASFVFKKQNEVVEKFLRADYQYFIEHKEGELIFNSTSAPSSLAGTVLAITELIAQGLLSISVLLLLFSLSWQGTISVLFIGLIYHLITRYLARRISYHSGKGQADAGRETIVALNEAYGGIKQVKVFANISNWVQRFGDAMGKYWYHTVRLQTWTQSLQPALMLILYLAIGVMVIVLKVVLPVRFSELIPLFGTFAFAVFRLVPVISVINTATMQIMELLPNCEVVYQIMNENITKIQNGDKELDSLKSRIEFDDVTFAYKGRDKVLKDVSIIFEKGKTTAIVGRSGSGKTTIINLLLRLFDVDDGQVKIDGLNIKEYRLESFLQKVGYVSQDTFVFNDTINNNISFGSDYTEEEITRACEYANAHGFISELPEGYNTLVGDRGMKLSGGQRQRIAVARAMVRKPEILIFDEATNALDNISEAMVQKAIDEISKDHTVILIAHRLSTVVNADTIVVIGDGHVLEAGTHKELMEKDGAYCELYRSQPV